MAVQNWTSLAVYVGGYNLACRAKGFTAPEPSVAELDTTSLCDTWTTRIGGLKSATWTADVMQDFDTNHVDQLLGVSNLGVSSPQLDRADRGFSYRHDGPIDMRMDPDSEWSAADVVNGYDEARLADVIARLGGERFARRIAHAIVAARPIETTGELAAVVTSAIPAPARRTGGHPAKRTFQAIRIEVNGELDALPIALDAAIEHVVPGGRVAVLSYHSGEDRIVKERFTAAVDGCQCPAELPCVCDAVQTMRIVRRVPKTPGSEELATNRRASSARLRVLERIGVAATQDMEGDS